MNYHAEILKKGEEEPTEIAVCADDIYEAGKTARRLHPTHVILSVIENKGMSEGSLHAIDFFCLCGRPVFEGENRSLLATGDLICQACGDKVAIGSSVFRLPEQDAEAKRLADFQAGRGAVQEHGPKYCVSFDKLVMPALTEEARQAVAARLKEASHAKSE